MSGINKRCVYGKKKNIWMVLKLCQVKAAYTHPDVHTKTRLFCLWCANIIREEEKKKKGNWVDVIKLYFSSVVGSDVTWTLELLVSQWRPHVMVTSYARDVCCFFLNKHYGCHCRFYILEKEFCLIERGWTLTTSIYIFIYFFTTKCILILKSDYLNF